MAAEERAPEHAVCGNGSEPRKTPRRINPRPKCQATAGVDYTKSDSRGCEVQSEHNAFAVPKSCSGDFGKATDLSGNDERLGGNWKVLVDRGKEASRRPTRSTARDHQAIEAEELFACSNGSTPT